MSGLHDADEGLALKNAALAREHGAAGVAATQTWPPPAQFTGPPGGKGIEAGAPWRATRGRVNDVADNEVAAREAAREPSVRTAYAMLRDDPESAAEPDDEANRRDESAEDKDGS